MSELKNNHGLSYSAGASLAQDRGRLESKVEKFTTEIKQLQGQLEV